MFVIKVACQMLTWSKWISYFVHTLVFSDKALASLSLLWKRIVLVGVHGCLRGRELVVDFD